MTMPKGLFDGDDPFDITRRWLAEAEATEPNDPSAIALATVDQQGLPDVRMVLLKAVDGSGSNGSFVFYTNYQSTKAEQIESSKSAAFVIHWKTLRRQIRVRGLVTREEGPAADEYYNSRALQSRIGAWASRQSQPLESRDVLLEEVSRLGELHGATPPRPPFWGGYRISPMSIEFWADGEFRLHDRFKWQLRDSIWHKMRLSP